MKWWVSTSWVIQCSITFACICRICTIYADIHSLWSVYKYELNCKILQFLSFWSESLVLCVSFQWKLHWFFIVFHRKNSEKNTIKYLWHPVLPKHFKIPIFLMFYTYPTFSSICHHSFSLYSISIIISNILHVIFSHMPLFSQLWKPE